MYWTAYNNSDRTSGRIFRASMDGNSQTRLFEDIEIVTPNGLAFDFVTQTLFFGDSRTLVIYRSAPDGNDFSVVRHLDRGSFLADMDYHDGILYWGDRVDDQVFSLRIDNSSVNSTLLQTLANRRDVGSIKVVDLLSKQPLRPSKFCLQLHTRSSNFREQVSVQYT